MPNTKTKKFDFQVFLAVFLLLLVICCAAICCVFGTSENGVANAYTAEEIGVSNLEFSVTDGFYFKNLSFIQLKNVVSYLSYYEPGLFDFTQIIGLQSTSGYVQMSYNNTMTSEKVPLDFFISQYSFGEIQVLSLQILVGGYDTNHITYFCNYTTQEVVLDSVYPFINNAGDYYFDLTGNIQNSETFANKIVSAILGADKVSTVTSIDSLSFTFNNTSNLGCLISANHTFATPPVVLPQSVYDGFSELQNQNTELQNQNTELQNQNTELQNQNTELQNQNTELQNQNTQLQTQLNEYQSYYDSIAWFDVLSSNLNNISTINIGGYKSNLIDVKANDGTGKNQVNVWNNESDFNTAFAIVMPRSFGNGTRFRFSYNGLIGSASGMANQPASLGYINSTGNLISIIELPTASSSYVEFNISEEVNTFVVYTSGNLIMFYDFRFQVFSLDVDSIYDSAYEDGVKHGYNTGYYTGYYTGKNEGIAQANDYSFFSLFSAVFDAPITAIVGRWGDTDGDGVYEREGGMLNFYIPGLEINFAPFLLSMFTIAIIVMIIRFILARRS